MQFDNLSACAPADSGKRRSRLNLNVRAAQAAVLASLLCAPPLWAQNAQTAYSRLGSPEVHSALGSPLWVKIPVESSDENAALVAATFSLGSRPSGASIPFLETAEISFERQGGKYYLVIRSRQVVNDLAIGLVVREQLMHGVRSREFALLLDPPPIFDARRVEFAEPVAAIATEVTALVAPVPPTLPVAAAVVASAARAPAARARRAHRTAPRISAAAAIPRNNRNARTAVARQESQLRLSLSTGDLAVLPNASEATRAELRLRQLILDTDDLTSALLERNHRIGLLETELSRLSARVSATERTLNGGAPLPATEPAAQVATEATARNAAAAVPSAPMAASPKATAVSVRPPPTATGTSGGLWMNVLMALAALVLAVAAYSLARRRLQARDETFRLVPQRADEYIAEVLAQAPPAREVTAIVVAERSYPATAPVSTVTPALAVESPEVVIPEIQFELPPLSEVDPNIAATAAGAATAGGETGPAADDARARRTRYLQTRYQDIAIMMPPLDAPQRLLNQAGRINDEGASDFAKRLLKYAVYSRPYTEEYWLALLELLYRDKFVNDYLVNAKWFHHYHPESLSWDEVRRIGYLLDPAAQLFASAAAGSHEEPAVGIWLPSNQPDNKTPPIRTELKLELAA